MTQQEHAVTGPVGTLEAADLAGITYRQIGYWIDRGYIATAGSVIVRKEGEIPVKYLNRYGQRGSGTQTRLDGHEVQVLQRMARLVHTGLAVSVAAKAARFMTDRDCRYAPLADGVVIWIREGP
jgi:hypothetical protein